jgi:hypothetical protein
MSSAVRELKLMDKGETTIKYSTTSHQIRP